MGYAAVRLTCAGLGLVLVILPFRTAEILVRVTGAALAVNSGENILTAAIPSKQKKSGAYYGRMPGNTRATQIIYADF